MRISDWSSDVCSSDLLGQCRQQVQALREQHESLLKQSVVALACNQCSLSDRAETTYLNIIGGMLILMLGTSPSGKPYSSFRTQEAVVSALVAHHQSDMGITEQIGRASSRERVGSARVK